MPAWGEKPILRSYAIRDRYNANFVFNSSIFELRSKPQFFENGVIPFSKSDATHLFEKTALRAEHKTPSVAISREIGISYGQRGND
ncbi:hypothetical protein TUMEXPCC7403_24290 [Tumidithrix helvetica PCC 7403]